MLSAEYEVQSFYHSFTKELNCIMVYGGKSVWNIFNDVNTILNMRFVYIIEVHYKTLTVKLCAGLSRGWGEANPCNNSNGTKDISPPGVPTPSKKVVPFSLDT